MRGLTQRQQQISGDESGDLIIEQQIRRIALAVERGDENGLNTWLHELCFDVVGIPVTRSLRISPPAPASGLRLTQDHLGPFARGLPDGATDVGSRLRMVREFDLYECDQALALPDLQPSVRKALEDRRRKLRDSGSDIERSGTG